LILHIELAGLIAQKAVELGLTGAREDAPRDGGVFTVFRPGALYPVMQSVLGPTKVVGAYYLNSLEKPVRIWELRQGDGGDIVVSSFSGRNTDASPPRFGGGIFVQDGLFFGWSGFDELADEVVCLCVAWAMGLIDDDMVDRILEVHGDRRE